MYRRRIMLLIAAIELALAFFCLHAMRSPGPTEQIAEPGRLIGMVMGVILGISPLLCLMARHNDRKKDARRRGNNRLLRAGHQALCGSLSTCQVWPFEMRAWRLGVLPLLAARFCSMTALSKVGAGS